ncbi:molecular chaperone, partial [Pseudomonas syringae]|nr:molecular chaperone [Pseudomonas syringae]
MICQQAFKRPALAGCMLLFMCAAYIPASQAALTVNATRIV